MFPPSQRKAACISLGLANKVRLVRQLKVGRSERKNGAQSRQESGSILPLFRGLISREDRFFDNAFGLQSPRRQNLTQLSQALGCIANYFAHHSFIDLHRTRPDTSAVRPR